MRTIRVAIIGALAAATAYVALCRLLRYLDEVRLRRAARGILEGVVDFYDYRDGDWRQAAEFNPVHPMNGQHRAHR